jgi:acetolactate synthase I/II/III large subunit
VRGPGYDPGLIQLAERLQVPVVTSWLRKNVFPNDCVLFCGSLGYGAVPVTEDLVREADVVLAIGCRFSEFTTGRWTLLSPAATLIQVDIEADSLGRYYVPAIGICADAAEATAALAAAVGALGTGQEDRSQPDPSQPGQLGAGRDTAGQQSARDLRSQRVAAAHAAYQEQTGLPAPPPGAALVPSAALVAALGTVLGRTGATLVQDAPSMGVWIQRHIDFTAPGTYYAAAGGSMGWGFPAAMGMQLARPGDGVAAAGRADRGSGRHLPAKRPQCPARAAGQRGAGSRRAAGRGAAAGDHRGRRRARARVRSRPHPARRAPPGSRGHELAAQERLSQRLRPVLRITGLRRRPGH